MVRKPLLPVADALASITETICTLPEERIPTITAHGRTAAKAHLARLSHPSHAVSAMDGYAARSEDIDRAGCILTVIDESAAGNPASNRIIQGTAIRIFTGAVVPEDADCIILQEDTKQVGKEIIVDEIPVAGRFIRKAGQDFSKDDELVKAGKRLTARDIGLLISGGISEVVVCPKPRVAIINSGDELVEAGSTPAAGQLMNSNGPMLSAMVAEFGGTPLDLGQIPDRTGALAEALASVGPVDLIVTTGGASVGDHDHIIGDLQKSSDANLNFWRIAMRPGKPLIFAEWNGTPLLGLPGNPVSAGVCALLFVQTAINKLQGKAHKANIAYAELAHPLPENDQREDYLRTSLTHENNTLVATAAARQDSAMLSLFAGADGLIIRPPFAEPCKRGDVVPVLRFPAGF